MDVPKDSIKHCVRALKLACFLVLLPPNAHSETLHYLLIGSNVAPLQYDLNSGKRGIIGAILDDAAAPFPLASKQVPWPRQIEKIKEGLVSKWVIYASKKWLDFPAKFSVPLFGWNHVLLKSKTANGKYLVLIKNFDYPNLEKWMTTHPVDKVYFAPSPRSALIMMEMGRAHMYVGEIARIKHSMRSLGMRLEDYSYESFSSYIPDDHIFLAFDPSVSDETIERINARILQMQEEGVMRAILEEHDWSSSIPVKPS